MWRYTNPDHIFGIMRENRYKWSAAEVSRTVEKMPKGLKPDDDDCRALERAANEAAGYKAKAVYTSAEVHKALLELATDQKAKMTKLSRKYGMSVDTLEKFRNGLKVAGKWEPPDPEDLRNAFRELDCGPSNPGPKPYFTQDETTAVLVAAGADKLIWGGRSKVQIRKNLQDAARGLAQTEEGPARRRRLD